MTVSSGATCGFIAFKYFLSLEVQEPLRGVTLIWTVSQSLSGEEEMVNGCHLSLNTCCQCMYPWMYVVPAADLYLTRRVR